MFKRILLYSHDSYGLGHFRRNLTIGDYLLSRSQETTILAITGSPRAHSFRLPHRFDYIKLPAATKNRAGRYVSREIHLPLSRLVALRAALITAAARGFEPDLVLVDHAPRGLGGELLPMLEEVRRRGARTVLGLRDVIDLPQRTRAAWKKDGVGALLSSRYDALLLYGDRRFFDPVREYGLSPAAVQRLHEVGYVVRCPGSETTEGIRARLRLSKGQPLVVVTTGGGGDGSHLLMTYLRGLHDLDAQPGFSSLLVTGPLLSRRRKGRLRDLAAERSDVEVVEFLEDLPGLYRSADLVVSMGGYNSTAEILDSGTPALIVPRVVPRLEQWVRAQLLARRGLVDCLHPGNLKGGRLLRAVRARLACGLKRGKGLPRMDGLQETWNVLERLAAGGTGFRPAAVAGSRPVRLLPGRMKLAETAPAAGRRAG
ncbi:MAG: glycosyltransferase family protein [Acidobacteriota bacterium]